ncbi:biopolymer transporter ExbD [Desulfohalobiaceae bacterium Ax17]|uniref:ExbD/TolR family protein n=1 Tax=Desulfovulcanus ferrireducens TaxID=2831190 RepID=UPI00207BB1E8|nr:biopolymer transporter ExbD [Desulfovulcanus ferrireducens]MBT8763235.1 biopolymer transporter ExbD [Desulfovulcanus ferrireducens]
MNNFRYKNSRCSRTVEINMAPLIDMVFILLIFFLVTTSFVKEAGVDVQRPTARSAITKEKVNMVIGVTKDGLIFISGKTVDIRSVRGHVERFLAENPEASVVVVADKASQTGTVIRVLDACRLAGAKNISIAAQKPNG